MIKLLHRVLGLKTCDNCYRAFLSGGKAVPVISVPDACTMQVEISYRFFCDDHKIDADVVLNKLQRGGKLLEESVPLKFKNTHMTMFYPSLFPVPKNNQ